MATVKDIQDKADAAVDPLVADLQVLEDAYIKAFPKGLYWQGLKTPTITPKDGADTPADGTVKPTGVDDKTWADVGVSLPVTLPASIEVHVHDGPKGKGFTVYAHVLVSKQLFVKAAGVGAYSHSHGWVEAFSLLHP